MPGGLISVVVLGKKDKKGATKYRTAPKELSNGKWSLRVTDYISLTEDENASTVSSVTYKVIEE